MTHLNISQTLDLPFKGTRDYLHGTDMVEALVGIAGPGPVSLRIHKIARSPLEVIFEPDGEDLSAWTAIARISDQMFGLKEGDGTVQRRVPYDEQRAIGSASRVGEVLRCARDNDFTLIEQIVALNKSSLSFRKPEVERWVFTELDLADYPASVANIAISPGASLGDRLVRSEVLFDGATVGKIGFSKMQG